MTKSEFVKEVKEYLHEASGTDNATIDAYVDADADGWLQTEFEKAEEEGGDMAFKHAFQIVTANMELDI